MTNGPEAPPFLRGSGKMGELMQSHDWRASSLGPPEAWPQSLRTAVSLMLNSLFPMFIAWGKDLSFLYNDAYRPILGRKDPQALGLPFETVWSDIWPEIEPLVQRALAGEATFHEDLHLVMERHGYAEDTWYTFSYSPVVDESGSVGGMFCACTETTQEVKARAALAADRQRMHDLFRQAPSFIAVTRGPDHVFEFANDAYLKLIGDRPDIIGKPVRLALPEIVDQGFVELLDKVLAEGKSVKGSNARVVLKRTEEGSEEERFLDFIYQPIRETDGSVTGIFVDGYDVTERKSAEDQQTLLARELNHRVKNLFAVVQGMITMSARNATSAQGFSRSLHGRLDALARAHELITPVFGGEDLGSLGTLEDAVNAILRPFVSQGAHDGRMSLGGPVTHLGASAMTAMALTLHELATNAAKYGSLSRPDGLLRVEWWHDDGFLRLRWDEKHEAQALAPPDTKGFGSLLIERSVAGQLEGEIVREWRKHGLLVVLTAPLERLRR